ncbi:MAG: class I SAM-dependent methyltransferase [Candidatus Taylorbacteria bacterium]|nr:class I SAM-dependent methyltransferase [Candidatus Taylorbacteria bacterium]
MNTAHSNLATAEVDWGPYYDAILDHPSTLARLALPRVTRWKRAVDLGSGKQNDARLMSAMRFEKIDSVDLSAKSEAYAGELMRASPRGFRFHRQSLSEYDFGTEPIDWVNSNFALPYDPNFRDIIERIRRKLCYGGVFSATFLGPKDEPYRMHSGFHTVSLEELQRLLAGFGISEVTEHSPTSPFFDGYTKQWHYFRAICIK